MAHCTCGVNSDLIGGLHEPSCGVRECGRCGTLGAHAEANCPNFRPQDMHCCGADTVCRTCPFERAAA